MRWYLNWKGASQFLTETTFRLLFWATIRKSRSGRITNSIRATSRRACSAQHTGASSIPMQISSFLIGTTLAESRNWRRSEEHTSELQSRFDLVCRLLHENK